MIVQRALAKDPRDRYPTVASMAQECALFVNPRVAIMTLQSLSQSSQSHGSSSYRFVSSDRIRTPSFSRLDWLTPLRARFGGLQSLGVRSSAVASRFAGDAPDLSQIARDAHVDLVLTGTFMHSNQQIRVNTQLIEAPTGTLLWSHTAQVTVRDVFQVQDDIVQRIVSSLALPLTTRERGLLRHDVPRQVRPRTSSISAPVKSASSPVCGP